MRIIVRGLAMGYGGCALMMAYLAIRFAVQGGALGAALALFLFVVSAVIAAGLWRSQIEVTP